MTNVTQMPRRPLGDTARKARVRAALKAVRSSQKECCDALGLSEATVSRAIAGLQRTPAVEAWICQRTGKTREELFDVEVAAEGAA